MGIDLYYMPVSAPCRMALLLAKHLGVEVNAKPTDLMKGEHLKPEYIKINPQHTVPTMVDDGFVLTESRAILQYLGNKYSKEDSLYPKDPQKRALVDMRLFFDVSTLYHRFSEAYFPVMFHVPKVKHDPAKLEKVDEVLGYVELYIKDGFAAGSELTIADFAWAADLSTIGACHDLSKFPKITAYLEKLKGLMEGYDELNQEGAEMFGQWYKTSLAKVNAE